MSRHLSSSTPVSSQSSGFRQENSNRALWQPLLAFLLATLLLTLSVASSLAGNELAAAGAGPASPNATFVVNDPGDAADADTADGLCDVDLVTPGLQCTLRAAIQEANAQPGLDTINFDLPPDSLAIQPASPLPDISEAAIVDASTEPGPERSEAAIVDGRSQPGATCLTPTVNIDGALAGASTDGLTISSGGSTVRGLIITRFPDAGLLLIWGAGNTVTCNLIGTDAAGSAGLGNGGNGITLLGSSDAKVALQRNEMADNAALGIDVAGDGVTPNDPGDGGPNLRQNYPVVLAAAVTGGATEVEVTFDGLPNAKITVELFHSPTCDPSGNGEGAHYLGDIVLSTDATGLAAGTAVIAEAAPPGHFVTATATYYVGATNFVTSEFSACAVVQAPVVTCTPGPHSGTIGADETWCASNNPHTLSDDVIVALGVTLTIEPDAVVKGNSNVELKVQDHLTAIGTAAQPITFTSATDTAANQWSGLIFDGGTGDLNYATVRYGGNVNSTNGYCSTGGLGFNVAVRNVLAGEVRLEHSQILSERFSCNNWTASD